MTNLNSHSDKTVHHLEEFSNMEWNGISIESGLPDGVSLLESQTAGHSFNRKQKTVGILRGQSGRILKAAKKRILGEREIAFYENLQKSREATMLELRNYVPKYYGTTELSIFGQRTTFLVLENITEGMAEPCIMDVKIGKRTWDPTATPEKRAAEEQKYVETKRTYGFSIPGFQVYDVFSKRLRKFGKDYGKELDAKSVHQALETFLNVSPERPPCRQLIVKMLSLLWKILLFFRTQKKFQFYSSSLLIAYDAKRLRHYLRMDENNFGVSSTHKTRSFSALNSSIDSSKLFTNVALNASTISKENSGLDRTCQLRRSISLCLSHGTLERKKCFNRSDSCGYNYKPERLCRTHSFVNNFDDDMARMREDYDTLLEELSSSSEEKQNWVRVNMIDFAHVFPAEDHDALDMNYLEGIENLIKLVEMFLIQKGAKQTTSTNP